jgi:hypothetical protein
VLEKNYGEKKVSKNLSNKLQKGLDLIPSSVNTTEIGIRTYKRKKIVINKNTIFNEKHGNKIKENKILNILMNRKEKENPQEDIVKSKEIKNIKKLNLNKKEIIRFNSDEILSTSLGSNFIITKGKILILVSRLKKVLEAGELISRRKLN